MRQELIGTEWRYNYTNRCMGYHTTANDWRLDSIWLGSTKQEARESLAAIQARRMQAGLVTEFRGPLQP